MSLLDDGTNSISTSSFAFTVYNHVVFIAKPACKQHVTLHPFLT